MNAIKNFKAPKFEEIKSGMDIYNLREHRIQTVLFNSGDTLHCVSEEVTNLKDWRLFGFKCGRHVNAQNFHFYLRDGWVWEIDHETRTMGALVSEPFAHKFAKVGVNVK